jgi:hypothetical protein
MSSNVQIANAFLPTTQTFSKDYDQYLLQITKRDSDITRAVNQREIAAYNLFEILTGQQWFDPANPQNSRNGFRNTFFKAAPLGAIASIPHGYTDAQLATFTWTHIFGTYTNKAGNPCGASVASEIDITTSAGGSVITFAVPAPLQVAYSVIVVLEYVKN